MVRGIGRLAAVALVSASPAWAQETVNELPAAPPALAQASVTQTFDIAAQPLGAALVRFSEATGIQLFLDSSVARGLQSPGVRGTMSREQALNQLLAGSGLVYRFTNANTVAVEKPGAAGAPGGAVQLDPVRVQANAPPAQAEIGNLPPAFPGGEVARGQRVGLLGNRDYMNTPFSGTAYTEKLIEDQQAITLSEVMANNPSVRTTFAQSAKDDRMLIRGFPIQPRDFLFNGMAGINPVQSVDMAGIERVELTLGPTAFLNGMTPGNSTGGVINLVPKRAGDEPLTRVIARYVSDGQFGGHADVGRRFGPDNSLGLRLNASYLGGNTAIQNQTDSLSSLTAGFDFRSDATRIDADLGFYRRRINGVQSGTFVAAGVAVPSAPSNRNNYYQPWEYNDNNDLYGLLRFEHDITPDITAFAKVGGRRSNNSGIFAFPTIQNAQGNTLSTFQGLFGIYEEALSAEVGARARVSTGPIRHDLALVGDYLRLESGIAQTAGTLVAPIASNIYTPFGAPMPNYANAPFNPPKNLEQVLTSIGFADSMSAVDDKIQLIAGGRFQRIQVSNYNSVTGITTAATPGVDQSVFSPSASLAFRPWKQVSFYGNYIQALQQGPVAGAGTTNAGQALPPFVSRQWETGVKFDFGTMGASVAAFSISQQSAFTNPATNTLEVAGQQVNKGLEFNVFGEPLEGLRVLGGVTLLDPKLTSTVGGVNNGRWAPGVPGLQVNLGTDYTLPFYKAVALNGRVIYTGQSYLDPANTQAVPAWGRVDIGARYTIERADGKPISLRANVINVGNNNYWQTGSGFSGFINQGPPRTYMLSLTADF